MEILGSEQLRDSSTYGTETVNEGAGGEEYLPNLLKVQEGFAYYLLGQLLGLLLYQWTEEIFSEDESSCA